jgi:hypothetical protein
MPDVLKPGFGTAILLCRACGKRSAGPPKKDAKKTAKRLRTAAREAGHVRPRVVLTACLGACPKKAWTLAALRPGGSVAMVAFRSDGDADAAVAALLGPQARAAGDGL